MTWSNKKQIWTQLGETFYSKIFCQAGKGTIVIGKDLGLVLIEGHEQGQREANVGNWSGWHDQTLDQKIIC